MVVQIVLGVIAAVVGGWMLADGIHVLRTREYYGESLGPWSKVIDFVGFDPYDLGWVFVGLGSVWLLGALCLAVGASIAGLFLMTAAILSLWYLPWGTVAAVATFILLLGFRDDVMA